MGLKAVATLVPGGIPVGGSGTPGTLAKFTGAGTSIGDSLLSESGTTITSAATAETFGSAQTWTLGAPNAFALVVKSNAGPEHTLVLDTIGRGVGIGGSAGTLLHVQDNAGFPFAGSTYSGVRLQRSTEALFSASDYTRSFRAGLTGATAVVGTSTAHDLLLQRGNVTALTLGASGAVAFAGNLTSSAAQTWTLAAGTSALNIQSGLLNLDTTNSRVGIGTASPTGRLHVVGGTAAAATNGAPVTIIAQNAGTGNQNGGNIVLTPGALSGTGSAGVADLSGPTGTGLKLPATPGNADAQTLDCYAEGTWTPTLTGFGGTAPTVTVARYTRIGRLVSIQLHLAAVPATTFSSAAGGTFVSLPPGMTPPVSAPGATSNSGIAADGPCVAYTNGNFYLPTFALRSADTFLNVTYTV